MYQKTIAVRLPELFKTGSVRTARRSSASGSRREGRAPGTSPASAAHSRQKRARRERSLIKYAKVRVACRRVGITERWPRVGGAFYPSGARTDAPRYVLAACRKSGAATATIATDTTPSGDTGHHFGGLEGGAAARGASWV